MSHILECQICGKKYDCCSTQITLNGWKSITCSHECYQEYLRLYVLKEVVDNIDKK